MSELFKVIGYNGGRAFQIVMNRQWGYQTIPEGTQIFPSSAPTEKRGRKIPAPSERHQEGKFTSTEVLAVLAVAQSYKLADVIVVKA